MRRPGARGVGALNAHAMIWLRSAGHRGMCGSMSRLTCGILLIGCLWVAVGCESTVLHRVGESATKFRQPPATPSRTKRDEDLPQ